LLYLVDNLLGSCHQGASFEVEHLKVRLMVAFQAAKLELPVCPTNLSALLRQVDTVKVLQFAELTDLCFVGEACMIEQLEFPPKLQGFVRKSNLATPSGLHLCQECHHCLHDLP
jgi:hypothetical protein